MLSWWRRRKNGSRNRYKRMENKFNETHTDKEEFRQMLFDTTKLLIEVLVSTLPHDARNRVSRKET